MNALLSAKYQHLREYIGKLGGAVVAFSGGVDSSLVAYVSGQVLGQAALAVTSESQSLKRSDLSLTRDLAETWGLTHRVINSDELNNPSYRANPENRCFYCKTSLYSKLREIADSEGLGYVINGTNLDDLGDHRPGLLAADKYQVLSPLVDCKFTKNDIRELAAALSLRNADKPAEACLASRVPYGSAINASLLSQVERAESVLTDMGFSEFRVRHHGDIARLELLPNEFDKAIEAREHIHQALQKCGYVFVAMDLKGFRSGSLNANLENRFIYRG